MQVTLLDPPPSFVFGAFEPVKSRTRSQRHSGRPYLIPLAPRPETEIKYNIQTEFHASCPVIVDQLRYTVVELRKLIDGRIIAIQMRHPLIMTEANGRQLLLQSPCKGGLSRTDVSMDQVRDWHIAPVRSDYLKPMLLPKSLGQIITFR